MATIGQLVQNFNHFYDHHGSNKEYDYIEKIIEDFQGTFLQCVLGGDIHSALTEDGITKLFADFLRHIDCYGRVSDVKGREDCGFTERDFTGISSRVLQCFKILSIFNKIINMPQSKEMLEETVYIDFFSVSIFLCAEHSESTLWSNDASLKESKSFLSEILNSASKNSVEEFLFPQDLVQSQSSIVFQNIYNRIQSKLQKQKWKQYPSLPLIFKWLLLHIRSPYIGDNLDKLLPPALMFIDDFQIDNRTVGVLCLSHIISQSTSAELLRYGRAEVIFEALHKQMSTHDTNFLEIVFPSILSILKILEPQRERCRIIESKWDDILPQILTDMELEDKLNMRRLYAKHLKDFVGEMGTKVAFHLKHVTKVLLAYINVYDNPEQEARLYALDVLLVLIHNIWTRMHSYCECFMMALMQLLIEVCDELSETSPSGKADVLQKCQLCLEALNKCCPGFMQSYIAQFNQLDLPDEINVILNALNHPAISGS